MNVFLIRTRQNNVQNVRHDMLRLTKRHMDRQDPTVLDRHRYLIFNSPPTTKARILDSFFINFRFLSFMKTDINL